VAPHWAWLTACINSSLGKRVGDLGSLVYLQIAPIAGTFHRVTQGNNGAYSASAGWNPCTGWGSPDGSAMQAGLTGKVPANPCWYSTQGLASSGSDSGRFWLARSGARPKKRAASTKPSAHQKEWFCRGRSVPCSPGRNGHFRGQAESLRNS
jgi:hypothetical protein